MTAFLQQYISPALPVILWLFRGVTAGLAVWLLVRCCKSLFRGRDRESWGFVTLSNGARYEIYHWENVIGRAKRSDIRINFPSVSRSHAILSRDEAGTWRVNPLNHSSGVLLNGQRTLTTADLHPGDSIAVGGVELFFFPSDKPQPSGQPRRRPGPVGGLWLLTFIQLLLWAQFAPNFGAENIYPISAGFFGLCGLGWVLYAVSRKLHRRQFDLEILALLLTTVGQLRALMFPVCSLAMAFLLFRGRPGRKLLAVAAELAGSLLMEMMFTPLMIDLKANDDISVWADPRALIYGVTFLPVLGLGLMLISFIFTRSKNNLSGRQLLVFSAFPITQMVCEASLVTLMFTPPRYEYILMQLTMSVLFLVSDILLYRTMVRTEQRVQLEVENELLERQLDAQLAHYRDLTAQYEQIRAMRHDIAHHLNTIHALLQAGNLQAASEYSEQLLPAQTYSSRLGACRNPVVDAFLYTRVQDAQARGVPVRADVSLPVELPVSNTDLIVAFGNLLDNALEACAGIPDAAITLRAHMDKGYLVIQESNPVRPRQPQGKKPRRIPELERGVGFRVLGGLAEKYDGSFRHTREDGVYTVTLLLRAAAAGVPAVPAHV